MDSRLIVVSNRVALPDAAPAAGGLAVAVHAALRTRQGVWFGWSGDVNDVESEPRTVSSGNIKCIIVDLTTADLQEYYNGYANRVLWPILHYRLDLTEFNRSDLTGYFRVNNKFALYLSKIVKPGDLIWIHDYHLIPLALLLRAQGIHNPIGFFLHVPCPPADILLALPQHKDVMGGLMSYDVVGLQTEADRENLVRYLELQGATESRAGILTNGRDQVVVGAFPVGIEAEAVARAAVGPIARDVYHEVAQSLGGRRLVISVDRLDYSKGLGQRMDAISAFLSAHPEWHRQVSFVQIAPKSRAEIPEYLEMDQTVSAAAGTINGLYGDLTWVPIRYVNKAYPRAALAGVYRLARVGLVTPLRDGMNLVSKEYVASQDPEDPGVLVLSRFAGAAAELDAALLVNPHEPEGVAAAIARGLEMDLAERKDRHARMLARVMENDIDRWATQFLAALESRRNPSREQATDAVRSQSPAER